MPPRPKPTEQKTLNQDQDLKLIADCAESILTFTKKDGFNYKDQKLRGLLIRQESPATIIAVLDRIHQLIQDNIPYVKDNKGLRRFILSIASGLANKSNTFFYTSETVQSLNTFPIQGSVLLDLIFLCNDFTAFSKLSTVLNTHQEILMHRLCDSKIFAMVKDHLFRLDPTLAHDFFINTLSGYRVSKDNCFVPQLNLPGLCTYNRDIEFFKYLLNEKIINPHDVGSFDGNIVKWLLTLCCRDNSPNKESYNYLLAIEPTLINYISLYNASTKNAIKLPELYKTDKTFPQLAYILSQSGGVPFAAFLITRYKFDNLAQELSFRTADGLGPLWFPYLSQQNVDKTPLRSLVRGGDIMSLLDILARSLLMKDVLGEYSAEKRKNLQDTARLVLDNFLNYPRLFTALKQNTSSPTEPNTKGSFQQLLAFSKDKTLASELPRIMEGLQKNISACFLLDMYGIIYMFSEIHGSVEELYGEVKAKDLTDLLIFLEEILAHCLHVDLISKLSEYGYQRIKFQAKIQAKIEEVRSMQPVEKPISAPVSHKPALKHSHDLKGDDVIGKSAASVEWKNEKLAKKEALARKMALAEEEALARKMALAEEEALAQALAKNKLATKKAIPKIENLSRKVELPNLAILESEMFGEDRKHSGVSNSSTHRTHPTHSNNSSKNHLTKTQPTYSIQTRPTYSIQTRPTYSAQTRPTYPTQTRPTYPTQTRPTYSTSQTYLTYYPTFSQTFPTYYPTYPTYPVSQEPNHLAYASAPRSGAVPDPKFGKTTAFHEYTYRYLKQLADDLNTFAEHLKSLIPSQSEHSLEIQHITHKKALSHVLNLRQSIADFLAKQPKPLKTQLPIIDVTKLWSRMGFVVATETASIHKFSQAQQHIEDTLKDQATLKTIEIFRTWNAFLSAHLATLETLTTFSEDFISIDTSKLKDFLFTLPPYLHHSFLPQRYKTPEENKIHNKLLTMAQALAAELKIGKCKRTSEFGPEVGGFIFPITFRSDVLIRTDIEIEPEEEGDFEASKTLLRNALEAVISQTRIKDPNFFGYTQERSASYRNTLILELHLTGDRIIVWEIRITSIPNTHEDDFIPYTRLSLDLERGTVSNPLKTFELGDLFTLPDKSHKQINAVIHDPQKLASILGVLAQTYKLPIPAAPIDTLISIIRIAFQNVTWNPYVQHEYPSNQSDRLNKNIQSFVSRCFRDGLVTDILNLVSKIHDYLEKSAYILPVDEPFQLRTSSPKSLTGRDNLFGNSRQVELQVPNPMPTHFYPEGSAALYEQLERVYQPLSPRYPRHFQPPKTSQLVDKLSPALPDSDSDSDSESELESKQSLQQSF